MSRDVLLHRTRHHPHEGQPELDSSAVSTCTRRSPNSTCSTPATRTPGGPNNNVVSSLNPVASLVCCLSNSKTSRGHGRLTSGAPTQRCPIKIEEILFGAMLARDAGRWTQRGQVLIFCTQAACPGESGFRAFTDAGHGSSWGLREC